MKFAYVDTSCVVAAAFRETVGQQVASLLAAYDELITSNLLEAELRAAARREDVVFSPEWLDRFSWILPDRPLHHELAVIFAAGYARGADAWHVACALSVVRRADELAFLTLDTRQARLATSVGLIVPELGA